MQSTHDRCFAFLDGISGGTERRLASQGIHTWADFLAARRISGISAARKRVLDRAVTQARDMVAEGDIQGLCTIFPSRERWRLYPLFREKCVFLDIETTGTFRGAATTVVGEALVRGIDLTLAAIKRRLRGKMIVTFFGTGFDLPVLSREFAIRFDPAMHWDLAGACRSVGLKGGLKNIEKQVGIAREGAVEGLSGWDAVLLWRRWRSRGDEAALDTLVSYNLADTMNLLALADHVYSCHSRSPVVQNSIPSSRMSCGVPKVLNSIEKLEP